MRACTGRAVIPSSTGLLYRTRPHPAQYRPVSSTRLSRSARTCTEYATAPLSTNIPRARGHPAQYKHMLGARPPRPARGHVAHATTAPSANTHRLREPRVEKSNGMTPVASEKRCISQPVARKTDPGDPLGRRNHRSWLMPAQQAPQCTRGPPRRPPPNAKHPTCRSSRVVAPGGCTGLTQNRPIGPPRPCLPAAGVAPVLVVVNRIRSQEDPAAHRRRRPETRLNPQRFQSHRAFSPPQNRRRRHSSQLFAPNPQLDLSIPRPW